MKKVDIMNALKVVGNGVKKHSPEILTAVGIAGMISTTVMAVKATPKAMTLIEEKKKELGKESDESLTPIETVQAAWKPYLPAAVTCVASTACIIGATSISSKRNAALMAACQISNTALAEWKEKAAEAIGEEKMKEVRDKIVEDKTEKADNNHNTYIINTEDDVLMYEPISNQYFKSSMLKVDKAVLELNARMINGSEFYMSFNDFLDELGLKRSAIGCDIGWSSDKRIDLTYEDGRSDNDKPCFVIAYLQPPFHDYDNYY